MLRKRFNLSVWLIVIAMAFLIITVISCTLTVRKNMQDKKRAEAAGEEFDTAEEEG